MPIAQTVIAQEYAAVSTATDEAPIGKLRPIAPANDPRHARAHVQFAIRIAAKQRIDLEPVHERPNLPRESAGMPYLGLYTVARMARDFKVIRLSDEFGQYQLYLRCASCGHERQSYPHTLANFSGWDATLSQIEKRLRCSKCGQKSCHIRAVPMQKPRGQPPVH